MSKDDQEIVFINKNSITYENFNTPDYENQTLADENTSLAIIKEYKSLVMENVTKLLPEDELEILKSVYIFLFIVMVIIPRPIE